MTGGKGDDGVKLNLNPARLSSLNRGRFPEKRNQGRTFPSESLIYGALQWLRYRLIVLSMITDAEMCYAANVNGTVQVGSQGTSNGSTIIC